MLDRGRIVFQGSPQAIQSSQEPVIRQFIRGQEPDAMKAEPSQR
jgi:ABC-type transporter Mla maintaining outer membrane lipid asymmetry ATPase subunit MlaF